MSFGNYFKVLRNRQNLNLLSFSKKAGIDPSYWSKVEKGLETPVFDLDRVSHVLGLDSQERDILRRYMREGS